MIDKIRLIVANKQEVPLQAITPSMKFSTMDIDSLDFVELMQMIEAEFWRIPDERWASIDSCSDVARELEACRP